MNSIQIIDDTVTIIDEKKDSVPLTPGDNCYLTVDGKKITSPIRITSNDAVHWHVKEALSPPFELTMSVDRLAVLLTVYGNCHNKWSAVLENGRDGTIINCVPEPDITRPVSVAEVMSQYRELKFQATIDQPAIEHALQEQTQKPVVIAKGEPAIEGKNGWVEAHFPLDEEVPFAQSGDKLNYREKRRIPIIHRHKCMATIHPPRTGKPGMDVRGDLILPQPTHAVNCQLTQNVYEEQGKIYTKITGRPSMTQGVRPILDIIPVYTVPGDVNLDTGHVRFEGDVIIQGNVMETMKVTAAQRIVVYGGVYGAELVAGGSIHVEQNIRKSKIYAGQRETLVRQLRQPLKHLYGHMTSAEKSRKLLEDEAAKKQQIVTAEAILHHLLNKFYPNIPKLTKETLRLIDTCNSYVPEELAGLREKLDRLNFESGNHCLQLATWQATMSQLTHFLDDQPVANSQSESIITQTADVSYLKVTGDVIFTGKGSTQSHIVASERILFTKPNASCRGGSLDAGVQIVAEHIGTLNGSKTECRAGKSIAARTVQHCDIQIEGPTRYVEEDTQIEYYREGNQTLFRHLK